MARGQADEVDRVNFVKLYIGDYLRDTGTLTLAQHGAYVLMLLEHYATEAPLPTGRELHRLLRADTKAEREAIDFIAGKFWQATDAGLINARAQQEIERASHQRAVNQELGKRGGRPRRSEPPPDSPPEKRSESKSESESENKPNRLTNRNPNQTPDTRQEHSELKLAPAFPPEKPPAQLALVASPPPPMPARVPDCPHAEILALWASELPALPQHNPGLWRGARAAHLRARWRETAASRGWRSEGEGIEFFRRLFRYVGQSRFLTGRAPSAAGRAPFVAELAWLVGPENWAKTIEGKYHTEAA